MSVIALASAKGSPGVTTTALALAAVWPRRVLVAECDPAGGDLACWFGLPAAPGLVTLGPTARRGLRPADVWAHSQIVSDALEVLPGFVRPDQAAAVMQLWQELPAAFAALDADVLADCGRLATASPVLPLLRAADVVVVLARPNTGGVAHLEPWLGTLTRAGVNAKVALLGDRPYRAADIAAALGERGAATEVIGVVADDRDAARRLAGASGSDRMLARSLLIRSARLLADAIGTRLALAADPQARRHKEVLRDARG